MKNTYIHITVFLILFLFFTGCIVWKPDSDNITIMDYNRRVIVTDAHYVKKITPIGYGSIIIGSIAGGFVGYNTPMISKQIGNQTTPIKPANAIIGTTIGYSLSMFLNYSLGVNKTKPVQNPENWIKKSNKNYMLLSQSSNNNFTLMHKSSEKFYVVKDMKDVKDFTKIFPNSSYTNNVASQTINNNNFMRDDYLVLMVLFPNNTSLLDMKKRYTLLSVDISSFFSAYDKFPETNLSIENTPTLYSLNNFNSYIKEYPNNIHSKEIQERIDKIESEYYENAITGEIVDCDNYFKDFPNGKYYTVIKKRKENIIEQNAYFKATIGNIRDCRKYLAIYPSGKFASQTMLLVDSIYNLRYSQAITGSIKKCGYYIADFPKGENIKEITERKKYLQAKEGWIAECDNYLVQYPEGKHCLEIKKRKKILIEQDTYTKAKNGDISDCEKYLSIYPFGKYINDVENLLVEKTNDIKTLATLWNKYPKIKIASEDKAFEIAKQRTHKECDLFIKYFFKSKYLDIVYRIIVDKSNTIKILGYYYKKYNVIREETDNKAYKIILDYNSIDDCNDYLDLFKNGKSIVVVESKLQSLKIERFDDYIITINEYLSNNNYSQGFHYLVNHKNYICNDNHKNKYNELYGKIIVTAENRFNESMSRVQSYISSESYTAAESDLSTARNYIINADQQQRYNYSSKRYSNAIKNIRWTSKLDNDWGDWKDNKIMFSLTIYRNSSSFKSEIITVLYYPETTGFLGSEAKYSILFYGTANYHPDDNRCYCSCGIDSYNSSSYIECIESIIKEYIYNKYSSYTSRGINVD